MKWRMGICPTHSITCPADGPVSRYSVECMGRPIDTATSLANGSEHMYFIVKTGGRRPLSLMDCYPDPCGKNRVWLKVRFLAISNPISVPLEKWKVYTTPKGCRSYDFNCFPMVVYLRITSAPQPYRSAPSQIGRNFQFS